MHICTHFAVSGEHLAIISVLPMVIQKTIRPHLHREQVYKPVQSKKIGRANCLLTHGIP